MRLAVRLLAPIFEIAQAHIHKWSEFKKYYDEMVGYAEYIEKTRFKDFEYGEENGNRFDGEAWKPKQYFFAWLMQLPCGPEHGKTEVTPEWTRKVPKRKPIKSVEAKVSKNKNKTSS